MKMSRTYTTMTKIVGDPTLVKEIVTKEDHDNFISNNNSGIMFFGSHKCPHCRDMVPVINNMAKQYPNVKFSHAEVTKLTTEDLHEGLPQFIAYKNHRPVDRVLGADPEGIINMMNINNLF